MLLARTLSKTLRQTQQEVDAAEFTTWKAAYELEPWGEDRQDQRAAVLAGVISASGGCKLKMDEIYRMVNPWANHERQMPSPNELARKIRLFNAGLKR